MEVTAPTKVPASHPGMLAIDAMFDDDGSKLEQAMSELSKVRATLWAGSADIGMIRMVDGILSGMADIDASLTSAVCLLNGDDGQ